MTDSFEETSFEFDLENAVINSLESHQQISIKNTPTELYLFPILKRPFFPGMAAPITIEPGPYYNILKKIAKSEDKCIGIILAKNEQSDIYNLGIDDIFTVGVLGRILRIIPLENGAAQMIVNLEKRMTISHLIEHGKYLKAEVTYQEDQVNETTELKAYSLGVISTIKELLKLSPLFKEELQIFLGHSEFAEPGRLADLASALTTASRDELQDILGTFDIQSRIDKAYRLLRKELDLTTLQSNISQKIDAAISKTQKDYFLREQLKTIKKELGIEKDDKVIDREKFEARLKTRIVPADVQKVITDEMEKLSVLETHSSEYGITRGYVDWLTTIPWGIFDKDNTAISHARKILEQDHYGLDDVKKRILEFIGVGKLSGSLRGSIICLLGPPGVGKTSIGKSIASALGRKFYRFSVGGMRDEAEIKGHRRTYIGAMPGKLVQALKTCQVMNPVIMLDEIDKMSYSYHGDPASALLEVLDPEQNRDFLDHYLDVRCDLSNILFIVTANVLDTIPEPLRDRMEILRLSGYITQEKVEIADRFLIPRNKKEMGLKNKDLVFTKDAVRHIIQGYAREAGVRNLENQLKKIMRKVALCIAEENESDNKPEKTKSRKISTSDLQQYLGKPIFLSDRLFDTTPVGVCTGLAWTSHGGATLYVEALRVKSDKTEMKLTGQAGSVMKESSEIAWSYLHGAISRYAPEVSFFEKTQVHIHIPEGATPKDGPSAGITMVTALLSLLMDMPVLDDLGMTGELTLTGRVLPIGGIKEKLVASRRTNLKVLIFPKENERDLAELPDYIKEGITFHFVEHYDEVFKIAFPEKAKAKNVKKKK